MDIKNRLARYFGKAFPRVFWRRCQRRGRALGIDKLYLILSFDCDTGEDAEAAEQIFSWLLNRGINATFAVPGTQLEENRRLYRGLAERGASFINHGYLPHAEWRMNRYWSITWYHKMRPEEVVEDIQKGHEAIRDCLDMEAKGFRAPHFGHFQRPRHLQLQYNTLSDLEYEFSTSTIPGFAFRHGPVYNPGRLWEIPVSGSAANPFCVFDSWGHLHSPEQATLKNAYFTKFKHTLDFLSQNRFHGILNYYVDPIHVCQNEVWFKAIDYAIDMKIEFVDYTKLIEEMQDV